MTTELGGRGPISEVATGMVLQVVSEGEVLPSPEPVTEVALNAPCGHPS